MMQRYRLPLVAEAPIPDDVVLPQPIAYYYLASEADAELDAMNLAVGYFHEENDRLITRIVELEKSHQRYEKLRRLDARQFHDLWLRSIALGEKFDDLVDRLPS